MNKFVAFIFSLTIVTSAGTAAFAMSHMSGDAMIMPTCSTGDPVVAVNMKTKVYMPRVKMHAGTSDSASMHMGSKSNMGMHKDKMMMSNMKMMCKSKADAMGAHMMKGSMMQKSSM